MKDHSFFTTFLIILIIIFLAHFLFFIWFQPPVIYHLYVLCLDFFGIVTWFAVLIIVKPPRTKLEIKLAGTGITPEMLEEAINEGMQKYNVLGSYLNEIDNPVIRQKIEDISKIVKDILDDLKTDPKDLKAARRFFTYYLDTTIKIIKQYIDLSHQTDFSDDVKKTLKRVEDLLDTIKKAFEKQLAKLLENDVINLDTELSVLEKTIKMEGLNND